MYPIAYLIQFADGSYQEINGTTDDANRYAALLSEGLGGKALVDALITDDWAAPPNFVVVTHRLFGRPVSSTIRYT